jgi:hypothetical protein
MDSKNQKTKTARSSQKKQVADEGVISLQNANAIVENKLENKVVDVEQKKTKKNKTLAAAPVVESAAVIAPKKSAKKAVVQPVEVVAEKGVVEKAVKKTKAVKKVVEAAPVVEAVADEELEQKAGSRLRYFKLFYNNEIQGRYCGKKPKQAANKAFSSIIKEYKKTGENNNGIDVDINFSIKECTRNSKHKEYKYVGKRLLLENPVKVEIANEDGSVKQIEYKFHNKLQKASKSF